LGWFGEVAERLNAPHSSLGGGVMGDLLPKNEALQNFSVALGPVK
jgi:hypothetical protein